MTSISISFGAGAGIVELDVLEEAGALFLATGIGIGFLAPVLGAGAGYDDKERTQIKILKRNFFISFLHMIQCNFYTFLTSDIQPYLT
jgi:hypothetical protein